MRKPPKPNERTGGWITTYTGLRFYPLDPRREDVNIVDIAHSLSNTCRFIGHCNSFYSVAQHSVLVSHACDRKDALWGLLHDASEAYVCDIPPQIKKSPELAAYGRIERAVLDCVCSRFGLRRLEPPSVKSADRRMFATEARDMTVLKGRQVTTGAEPFDFTIDPWDPETAFIRYIARFNELTGGRLT